MGRSDGVMIVVSAEDKQVRNVKVKRKGLWYIFISVYEFCVGTLAIGCIEFVQSSSFFYCFQSHYHSFE